MPFSIVRQCFVIETLGQALVVSQYGGSSACSLPGSLTLSCAAAAASISRVQIAAGTAAGATGGEGTGASAMTDADGGAGISAGSSCTTGTLRLRVGLGFEPDGAGTDFCVGDPLAAATRADLGLLGWCVVSACAAASLTATGASARSFLLLRGCMGTSAGRDDSKADCSQSKFRVLAGLLDKKESIPCGWLWSGRLNEADHSTAVLFLVQGHVSSQGLIVNLKVSDVVPESPRRTRRTCDWTIAHERVKEAACQWPVHCPSNLRPFSTGKKIPSQGLTLAQGLPWLEQQENLDGKPESSPIVELRQPSQA